MINFLHTFLPQPILFQFGFIKVYWYGVLVVLGIILGLFVVLQLAKRLKIDPEEIFSLGFYVIIFGLLGARLYAIFLELDFYLAQPFEMLAVWHGGLAIHGAIIGGAVTALVYCYFKKQAFWPLADLVAPAIALGQAVGRFGNYFNQEIFGKPTNLPWGIPIAQPNRPLEYLSQTYFQPTFLYESVLDLINFFVLLFLFFWIYSKNQAGKLASWQAGGLIFLVYLTNYSLIRMAMEFLRVDQTPIVFGLRLPVLVSLGIITVSVSLIIYRLKPKLLIS